MKLRAYSRNLSVGDLLASLSYALDLTSGYPAGHAQRSCLIAMRIGKEIGLSDEDRADLYHAVLLKDSGCSSNAARMAAIFGNDDIAAKQLSRVTDWTNAVEALKYVSELTLPTKSFLSRAARVLHIATHKEEAANDLMRTRCERGAQIALSLGLSRGSADCIRSLDEHWDGKGAPNGVRGSEIPILARIACLAQTMDVFARTFDVSMAYEIARKRAGRWFDPELVRAAQSFEADEEFWSSTLLNPAEALQSIECQTTVQEATESRIDAVCEAFAQVVDAKSSFTAEHSSRVCDYTMEIAIALGISGSRLRTLRRASLLHDLGKLSVSNAILDKPGRPTDEEWVAIKKHPYHSFEILSRITGFERIAEIAAAHHERLDGKGYYRGIGAEQLDLDMRALSAADVFDALTAARPYREALSLSRTFEIMDKDAGLALDPVCIEVLKSAFAGYEMVSERGSSNEMAEAA